MNQAKAEGAQDFVDDAVHNALEEERNRIIGTLEILEQKHIDGEIDFDKFVYLLTLSIEEGGD